MCSPYPEFVLTGVICIEKALKGTEIVYGVCINRNFVLSVFVLARFYCIYFLKKFTKVNISCKVNLINTKLLLLPQGPTCYTSSTIFKTRS